jgi:dTDP-4-amino-4,6-dideoxygalactose transaminase
MYSLIPKLPVDTSRYLRPVFSFPNARTALKAYLQALDLSPEDEILLPGYIGWSKNEGSGVFDPIAELGIKFAFYRLTPSLGIDLDYFIRVLRRDHPRVVIIIHYFGYPDANLAQIVHLAHSHGSLVLEDEAHALYSDWIGGICGRYGDATILSLHKMIPVNSGGLLMLNKTGNGNMQERLNKCEYFTPLDYNLLEFDFAHIAKARRNNTAVLMELVAPLRGRADLLFQSLPDSVVPQTLPILIRFSSRDRIYDDLNNSGYGVVSLYHTLIEQITREDFPVSYHLSRQILNLPVHQDISTDQLEAMVIELSKLV